MMTPQEGSKLCIRMAGYGIRHDVVKAIQEDALKEVLNRCYVPTIRIEHDVEYPMTMKERVEWAAANLTFTL